MKPTEVLARHGSSFHLASRFLRPGDAADVTTLYAVCRLIDDLADERHDESATIEGFIEALETQAFQAIPVEGFADLMQRRALDPQPLITLARTAWAEAATPRLIADEAALIDYCYGVAGTVGELMCPLIGADPERGRDPAIALGIGMQLTNIARDVLEDARAGRRYLPGEWVSDFSPVTIAEARPIHREPVRAAIRQTVTLAESYYQAAEDGLALIPLRNRQAIRIAARLYRAIGLRVREQGCRYCEGRVSLNGRERAKLAFGTLAGLAQRPDPQDV